MRLLIALNVLLNAVQAAYLMKIQDEKNNLYGAAIVVITLLIVVRILVSN